MTVAKLRKLIRGLPGSMDIMMDTGDGVLESVCGENSQVEVIPLLYEDETEEDITEDTEAIAILVFVPCNNVCEMEEGEINSQPELN